jgi:hemerythrin-like domain-containing protein
MVQIFFASLKKYLALISFFVARFNLNILLQKGCRMKFLSISCIALACCSSTLFCGAPDQKSPVYAGTNYLTPNENLMREHGVLNRVLLIYQEIARRINDRIPFPPEVLEDTVHITRDFLENFHEKLEEDYVFPRFEKANMFVDIIKTLKDQHLAGKKITDYLLAHGSKAEVKKEVNAMVLAGYLSIFCRMFRPHEARESSELFPVFPSLMPQEEYLKLGSLFEKTGEEMFGANGYEKVMAKLMEIEQKLDLYSLRQFTS